MDGLDQLDQLSEDLKKQVAKLVAQVADQVPNVIKPITPVRTGHLKRSWRSRQSTYQATVQNTAYYAGFVEHGTKKMAARPMITPLVPQIEQELARAWETGTDFYLRGGAFKDPVDMLREQYQAKYGGYGNHRSYRG